MENKNSKNNQIRHSKINDSKTTINSSKIESQKKQTDLPTLQQNQSSLNKLSPPKKQNQNNLKSKIKSAFVIFSATFLIAILGTIIGGKMVNGRVNPPAYPPNWIFPIAWGILYVLIALSSFIFYQNKHSSEKRTSAMVWYSFHLFFNLFWPLFYFRLNQLIISCFILLAMVITAIVLTFKYFKNNLISGWLFTFYTLWLLYAMYLNLGVTLLNI